MKFRVLNLWNDTFFQKWTAWVARLVCLQNGVRICIGDAVELQPMPGDADTGVGIIEAVWADAAPGAEERWQARCRKLVRPSVRASLHASAHKCLQ